MHNIGVGWSTQQIICSYNLYYLLAKLPLWFGLPSSLLKEVNKMLVYVHTPHYVIIYFAMMSSMNRQLLFIYYCYYFFFFLRTVHLRRVNWANLKIRTSPLSPVQPSPQTKRQQWLIYKLWLWYHYVQLGALIVISLCTIFHQKWFLWTPVPIPNL